MRVRASFVAASLAAWSLVAVAAVASHPVSGCDFDADGYADVVLGAPDADGGGGAVFVVPGGPDGPVATSAQKLTQNSAGMPGATRPGDRFGAAIACGDFDDDGFPDLAIGVPGERVDGLEGAGAVYVIAGSATGPDPSLSSRWTLRKAGLEGAPAAGGRFGSTLVAGDFDGDGYADLAAASPGASSVHVLRGRARGLTARDVRMTAAGFGVAGTDFGIALAPGDFDRDGRTDLAIGAPDTAGSGAVVIVWGAKGGIDPAGHRVVHLDTPGIKGAAKPDARVGAALAAGDFDADDRDDLAIGAPGYRYAGSDGAGATLVLFGSRTRTGTRDMLLTSALPITDAQFGWSLAAGDVSGDGVADLAVGAPTDDGAAPYAGRVDVRRGPDLSPSSVLVGHDLGAGFGSGVRTGDIDGDGRMDLVIGAPYAPVGTALVAGVATFVPGPAANLDQSLELHRATPGIAGPATPNEAFGRVGVVAATPEHPGVFLPVESRVSWTDRDPITTRLQPHAIDEITIHHLAGGTTPTGPARFRVAQDWHMDGQGWGDLAYHYIVGKDGRVYAARPPSWAGDTATNYDPHGHLLVVVEGNFEVEEPTPAQLDTLVAVVAWAVEEWDVPLDEIGAHRDHASTTCPGGFLYPFIASGDLVDAVTDLLDAGGVWPVPRSG